MSHDYSKNVVVRHDLIARGGTFEFDLKIIDEALAQSGIGVKRSDIPSDSLNVLHRLSAMAHRAGYVQGATQALAAPIAVPIGFALVPVELDVFNQIWQDLLNAASTKP